MNKPTIIRKGRNNLEKYTLEDEMLRNRTVLLMGSVEKELVDSLVLQLLHLENDAAGEEITIMINSGGGEIGSGLVIYDIMQAIKSPVRTVCVGMAYSMAAVLFAAGDKREIYPHSRVMIHDPAIAAGQFHRNALELKNICENLMVTRQSIAEILARHTGQSIDAILEKTCIDSYFSAEEAVEFGLADKVISPSGTVSKADN